MYYIQCILEEGKYLTHQRAPISQSQHPTADEEKNQSI